MATLKSRRLLIGSAFVSMIVVASVLSAFQPPTLWHVLTTGQSLSVGGLGGPAITTSQPAGYNNFTLNKIGSCLTTELGTAFVGLTETANCQESPASAAGAQFTHMSGGSSLQIAITKHGSSSTPYSGLKRIPAFPANPITGTVPYQNGRTQVSNVLSAASGLYTVRPGGVIVTHGETDSNDGVGASDYEGFLLEWYNAYTGDRGTYMPLFVDQLWNPNPAASDGNRPTFGQLQAVRNYPGKIYGTTPKYPTTWMAYGSFPHLTAAGYRYLGEQQGKVMYRVLVEGQRWIPLMFRSTSRVGAVITVRFWAPFPPLVIDTTNVADDGNCKGFRWLKNGATTGAPCASVTVAGDTATIALASAPTDVTSERLAIAWFSSGGTGSGAAHSNIRDSDPAVGVLSGAPLYNWAWQEVETVPYSWEPGTSPSMRNVTVRKTVVK